MDIRMEYLMKKQILKPVGLILVGIIVLFAAIGFGRSSMQSSVLAYDQERKPPVRASSESSKEKTVPEKVTKSDQEWQQQLSTEQFYVLRRKGTERAFTGAYHNSKEKGVYHCAACDNALFSSDAKFDSGTGWPSYWQAIAAENIETETDASHGMKRVEVKCSKCGSHLGHVFDDGPKPTGLRYCINSVALKFEKQR